MGGLMSVTGLPGQGPVRAGIAVADSAAGLYCAFGILAALLEREVTGKGSWVQTSLLAAQIALMDFQAARVLVDGDVPGQAGNDHPVATPMGLFETEDGHVNIAAHGQAMYARLCEAIGRPELSADERFATARSRLANRAILNAEISKATRTKPTSHWVDRLNAIGIPCGPVLKLDEVFEDPQVKHLKLARAISHPTRGELRLVGQPLALSGHDAGPRTPAPELGQHTDEILRELGYSDTAISKLHEDGVV
jgi:crotonobetainyl-CoA:carnitine CoA-transferase CaiB-like acyl-CoA transferase